MTKANELLGWLPVSKYLDQSLVLASAKAENAGVDEVAPEHLLAALLEDIEATEFFAQNQIKRQTISAFLIKAVGEAAMADVARAEPKDSAPIQSTARPAARAPMEYAHGAYSVNTALANTTRIVPSRINRMATDILQAPINRRTAFRVTIPMHAASSECSPRCGHIADLQGTRCDTITRASEVDGQASLLAEQENRPEVDSEIVIRAMAFRTSTPAGLFLKDLLLPIPHQPPGFAAVTSRKRRRMRARHSRNKSQRELIEPAFDLLKARIDKLTGLIKSELNKDDDFRLASELSPIADRRQPHRLLGASSDLDRYAEILREHALRDLAHDPRYQALEHLQSVVQHIELLRHGV